MIETIQIDGPSGRISAELLLPGAFDKAHGRCGLVMLMHGFLGSKRGALTGYAGGLDRKASLLRLEGEMRWFFAMNED